VKGFARFVTKRTGAVVVALLGVALLAGGSWAATGSRSEAPTPEVTQSETTEPSETPESGETPDADETQGNTIERYHGEDCTLATGLEGNWTHGDYVSAVAQDDDDATNVSDAAQSRCGKPLNAGPDGEKTKDENSKKPDHAGKPDGAGKGGRSADHRQDGGGS
jgi:hypothetical protein